LNELLKTLFDQTDAKEQLLDREFLFHYLNLMHRMEDLLIAHPYINLISTLKELFISWPRRRGFHLRANP